MLADVNLWARRIKRDIVALWIAARDPRTPLLAKFVAGAVAAYALSPIDLIPDFIPVLGYLNDLLIVPAGILIAVALIPPALMEEFHDDATGREGLAPSSAFHSRFSISTPNSSRRTIFQCRIKEMQDFWCLMVPPAGAS
ncbi:YkvA family protein [Phyllobacterium sp. UNC302MFCol5.2]|uniref:YkvA family protein n=1 Tax=Phyllobacterium sp. UNC302MFCol5.2 TaxID=1449065 RepID=UPI0009E0B3EE|nr:YkvA family protein [Phyllobacterium sp. UNC302MFCol5.2]